MRIDGCKVFSSTKFSERELLGESVTQWLRNHPNIRIVDKMVRQSSDEAFHCISIVLFFQRRNGEAR